ncbi:unnamed protein product, partial [Mesorhabditis spiculigera]
MRFVAVSFLVAIAVAEDVQQKPDKVCSISEPKKCVIGWKEDMAPERIFFTERHAGDRWIYANRTLSKAAHRYGRWTCTAVDFTRPADMPEELARVLNGDSGIGSFVILQLFAVVAILLARGL